MAAPVEDFGALSEDTGNAGKRIRLNRRGAVGPGARYDNFVTPVSPRAKLGIYYYSTAVISVQAGAQDGIATAFWWFQNPIGSGRNLVLRELLKRFSTSAVTAAPSAPRIILAEFTFGGAATGASMTPAKSGRVAAETPLVGVFRTVPTGMTAITLGATIATFLVPAQLTGVGHFGSVQVWPHTKDPFEDDGRVIIPGTGAVLYQPDAGTAGDVRRFTDEIEAEEVDV